VTADYGFGELAAAVLARRLRDGELGIVTTTSPVAVAACGLAQRRGRWISWLSLPLATLDARSEHLRGAADERLIPTATAALDLADILGAVASRPHFFDFGFLDALQVDRHGNVNTVAIGDHDRPAQRGPGVLAASAVGALARRFMVLLDRHDPTTLVERVDFRSAVGHHEGGQSREALGLPPGGPDLVLTPLGCFDFEPASKAMRVASVHPGVTLGSVQSATGFELVVHGTLPETEPPTDEELNALRLSVDADGLLRGWAGRGPRRR
jgi:glutaconate CoA-transferase subunit B